MEDEELEPNQTDRIIDQLTFNDNTTDKERYDEKMRMPEFQGESERKLERDGTLSEILSNVSDIQRQLQQVHQIKRHNVLNDTQELHEALRIVTDQKLPAIFKILNLLSQFTREQEKWNDRIRTLEDS